MSLPDLAALLGSMLPGAWQLDAPRGVPTDVVTIADPRDPLVQSQLWGAIYSDLPIGFLVETCLIESGCTRAIGVHAGDAHLGAGAWRGVWRRSRIDRTCAFYPDPSTVDEAWFREASTRGNHGLIAAYHVSLLGDCVPLDALDLPFFSAWAAAEKARRACVSLHARGLKCTRERLRCAWAHARVGSKTCRATVKRYRDSLARRLEELRKTKPGFDSRARITIEDIRKQCTSWRTQTQTDPQLDT